MANNASLLAQKASIPQPSAFASQSLQEYALCADKAFANIQHDLVLRMKNVLLVDVVEAPAEFAAHPLGSVEKWFGQHLSNLPGVELLTLPASSPELSAAAKAVDAIIISGSPRDAWVDSPDIQQLIKFVQEAAARLQPILGVCFGHQLVGRALGGEVRQNPAGWEVGAPSVQLTTEGVKSPLFAGFSAEFPVIQSHRDAVLTLPPGATLLATNASTPVQAFSLEGRIFGVQFHPEMDGTILRHLWEKRRDKVRGQVGFDLDQVLDTADADSSRVLHNFIRTIS